MRSRRAPWPLDHPGRGAKAHSRRARELTARLLAPVVTRAQLTRRAYALVSAHIRGIVCLSSAEVRSVTPRRFSVKLALIIHGTRRFGSQAGPGDLHLRF